MAEQLICNQQVDGSTPFTSSNLNFYGGIPERPKGADCKSVVTDFAGPNPASPTITRNRVLVTRFFVMWSEAVRQQRGVAVRCAAYRHRRYLALRGDDTQELYNMCASVILHPEQPYPASPQLHPHPSGFACHLPLSWGRLYESLWLGFFLFTNANLCAIM